MKHPITVNEHTYNSISACAKTLGIKPTKLSYPPLPKREDGGAVTK